MSIKQAPIDSLPDQDTSTPVQKSGGKRTYTLCILLLLVAALVRIAIALPYHQQTVAVVSLFLTSFVPYLAGCILVLRTRARSGRWQWLELGLILLGALLARALLLPSWPIISGDVWRYLWDARVTLHGYSPYVVIPDDPRLVPLHDPIVYAQMGYHTVPTLYPPAAQAIYLVSYLLAPSNLVVLKAIFMGFDLVTCGMLAFLLKRKGLDPARCIIYAWCPLPIVEFGAQGHIDVAMITFITLTLACAYSTRRGARVLTGFFLALATLAKLYPILLLAAVVRRRDYALVFTYIMTVIVAYVPYFILGHGQVFGFFSTYLSQHGGNAGPILVFAQHLGETLGFQPSMTELLDHGADIAVMGSVGLVIFVLRQRELISIEAAILILIASVLSVSAFVYPWYVTALLPWVALLLGPLWTPAQQGLLRLNGKTLAVLGVWYFVCTVDISYLFLGRTHNWTLYYIFIYGVVGMLLVIAAIVGIQRRRLAYR